MSTFFLELLTNLFDFGAEHREAPHTINWSLLFTDILIPNSVLYVAFLASPT